MTSVTNGTHRADIYNPDAEHLAITIHGDPVPVTINLSLAEGHLLLAALLAHGIVSLR